jgi:hypothetical protein
MKTTSKITKAKIEEIQALKGKNNIKKYFGGGKWIESFWGYWLVGDCGAKIAEIAKYDGRFMVKRVVGVPFPDIQNFRGENIALFMSYE